MELEMTGRIKQIVKRTTHRKRILRMSKRSTRTQPSCFESSLSSQYIVPPLETSSSSCQNFEVEQTVLLTAGSDDDNMLDFSIFDRQNHCSWSYDLQTLASDDISWLPGIPVDHDSPLNLSPPLTIPDLAPAAGTFTSFNCMDIKETILFMHYFDQVFSNQLRFYGLSFPNTDRGWLLSLMTQTKSLYSGILGLSASYKQSLLLRQTRTYSDNFTYNTLEKYVVDAFKELRISVAHYENCVPKDLRTTIEAVTCIIQLIFLDVSSLQAAIKHER